MPKLLTRLISALALAVLLLGGAIAALSGTASAQVNGIDSGEEGVVTQPVTPYLVNYETTVDTSCEGRAYTNPCETADKFFVFDTAAEYYDFLRLRTEWWGYRLNEDLPSGTATFWSDFRHSDEAWPTSTAAVGDAPASISLEDNRFVIYRGCYFGGSPNKVCSYGERLFDFADEDEAIDFVEARAEWYQNYLFGDRSVSWEYWESYDNHSRPASENPYMRNSPWSVPVACPDDTPSTECTFEMRNFQLHTKAQYAAFLKQLGDVRVRLNDVSANDVAWDFWKAYPNSTVFFSPLGFRDTTVSSDMELDDVGVQVYTECLPWFLWCNIVTRFFDFTDKSEAVDFFEERVDWISDLHSGDTSIDEDWWMDYTYTLTPGVPALMENKVHTVETACDGRAWSNDCDTEKRYFLFNNKAERIQFLQDRGDWWLYRSNADAAPAGRDYWEAYSSTSTPRIEGISRDPNVSAEVDLTDVPVQVYDGCDSADGCSVTTVKFNFTDKNEVLDFMQARLEWLKDIRDGETADHDWWEAYDHLPPVLQGLRINSIPWCYSDGGEQVCEEITRYFWHRDWQDRGAFQQAHLAWQDGSSDDWDFWIDYDWGYDRETIVTWKGAQNQRISVQVLCPKPFLCYEETYFFNFADWDEKVDFQSQRDQAGNSGTLWSTEYWKSFDWSETPH